MYVLLRLIARCPDAAAAARIHAAALARLQPWQAQATMPPEPCAGRPGQIEFTYRLQPGDQATFDAVVRGATGGWHLSGDEHDASAVWTAGSGPALVGPEVVWAELIYSANGQLG
ncbi:MAG: hypothetical protein CFE45_20370 [Burkholderiales bacterium PBB5]|nr:MAG: hypothetical protein CFE45_20370 [Burkholderiales bacterium PBB5]